MAGGIAGGGSSGAMPAAGAFEARARPAARPSGDYRKTTGTYYVQDVYAGPSLAGSRAGREETRVVALDYRAAGVGNNGSGVRGGGR